jgi:hypothetical protein
MHHRPDGKTAGQLRGPVPAAVIDQDNLVNQIAGYIPIGFFQGFPGIERGEKHPDFFSGQIIQMDTFSVSSSFSAFFILIFPSLFVYNYKTWQMLGKT